MKIVIVEDEQRARRGLKDLICSLSEEYEVIAEASNGQKALELIKLLKPEVVFTDIKMPYMNGIELIRTVRALKININFVVISAYAEFDFAQQAISLGVVEYLLKPLSREEIERALTRIEKKMKNGEKYNWEKNQNLRSQYPDVHPTVLKLLDIIENSYSSKLSQKELAASFCVSPEYLSYLFKKEIGVTFAHFLQEYRIEIAKNLYLNGECDSSEIPFLVGFSDSKYFFKVFRDRVGMSVNQYLSER